jgi:hypothetical protein
MDLMMFKKLKKNRMQKRARFMKKFRCLEMAKVELIVWYFQFEKKIYVLAKRKFFAK